MSAVWSGQGVALTSGPTETVVTGGVDITWTTATACDTRVQNLTTGDAYQIDDLLGVTDHVFNWITVLHGTYPASVAVQSGDSVGALAAGSISETSHTYNSAILASDVDASGGIAPRFRQWQRRLSVGPGAWADLSSETAAGLSDTGLAALTGYDYRRRVTDSSSPADVLYTNTVSLTTDATPSTLSAGTIALDSTTNDTAVLVGVTPSSGGFGGLTYGWRRAFSVVFRTLEDETDEDLTDAGIPSNSLVTYERFVQDTTGNIAYSNAVLAPIGPLTIESEIQNLSISAFVEMFEVDTTDLGGDKVYFHAGTNELREAVVWQGIEYQPFPVEASGFEKSGTGTAPQPKLRVANITSLITALCDTYEDLLGAKVTRRRTLLKYLDAVNFAGSVNTTANPEAHMPDEIWYVNRKSDENAVYVDFEMSSSGDVSGKQLPGRQIVANICQWQYRSTECSYAGGPVADANDNTVTTLALDVCGKRISSCKLRFGTFANLQFGGFPGAGLVR